MGEQNMKMKNRGLIIGIVALLMISVAVPVYAQAQNGILDQDRDQECTPQGPATRAYGEETPTQAQQEKPESTQQEISESIEEPTQEQTQTKEQLQTCQYENEDCEQYQYQYKYQYQKSQED